MEIFYWLTARVIGARSGFDWLMARLAEWRMREINKKYKILVFL